MFVHVMTTDGGPHPPEKWALATAMHIVAVFNVDKNSPRAVELELAKDEAKGKIVRIMIAHHTAAQDGERGKIAEHGHDRLLHDCDPGHHCDVESVVAEVMQAVKPLLAFIVMSPEVELPPHQTMWAVVKERVENDVRTIMHIERSWHADRNPNTEQARDFRAQFHG